MKKLLPLFLLLLSFQVHAQIIAPDTVCAGTSVSFTTTVSAVTYSWEYATLSVNQPISPLFPFYTSGGSPTWACFNNDGGNYYTFLVDYTTGNITRLSYGTSIYSTPVVTNLGSFGATGGNTEGIDVVKDELTGLWYGLVVNYTQMIVLSFGASLAGTPTATVTTYPDLQWPHQVTIKRYNGNWSAFVANRNTNIVRFDFGASLTSVPVVTNIPNVGGVANPCNFSLYEQAGNWYMLITNLINGSLSRYDFGVNLLNNAPTGTLLAAAGTFDLPRPVNILNDCQGNLIAYVVNETGQITKLDFAGDITTTPTLTSLGASGTIDVNSAAPCAYGDSLSFLLVNYSGVVEKYYPFYFVPTTAFIDYYNPAQNYTFASPGSYNVSLFCDQGYTSGPSVFCKPVDAIICSTACDAVVMPDPDTLHLCVGDTSTLYASVSGSDTVLSYLWSPATGLSSTTILNPVLTATTSGWYDLTIQSLEPYSLVINGNFSEGNYGFSSTYIYSAPPSTTLIEGDYSVYNNPHGVHTGFLTMGDHTTGTGDMMIINGGSTASAVWCETIPVTPNTNYDFSAWFADCSAVTVGADVPVLQFQVNGVLLGVPAAVTAPPGTWMNFFSTWNSGVNTTATICIYDETTAAAGNDFVIDDITFQPICVSKDSIYVKVNNPDTTRTHTDTSVCANSGSITIGTSGYLSYVWSTGATTSTIVVTTSGHYIEYDSSAGCAITADTFDVTYKLLDTTSTHVDTTVCANITSITLTASTGYSSYYWNNGSAGGSVVVGGAGSYWVDETTNTCSVLVDTFDVLARALPVVSLGNDTGFCQGDSLVLTVIEPAGDTLLWSNGSSGDSIHITTSGTYGITVRNGCVSTASILVTVTPTPLVNLGPDTSDCIGTPIVLQSEYTYPAGTVYAWSDGTSGATTTVTTTGTYWLQVTESGCPGSDTINVAILYDTFTLYNRDTAICKGHTVQVLATGNTAAQTYLWEPDAGIANVTSITPLITPDTSATYAVFVFYPGCPTLVDSFHIDVQPNPTVYIGGNRSVCDHDTLHINAFVTPQWYPGYIYSWTPALNLDNTGSSTVVFTAGDTTEIILTVTTPAGCTAVDSAQLIVHTDSFVHYDTSLSLCPGDSVQLKPRSDDPGTNYVWHPAMYMSDTNSSMPWVFPLTTQLYYAVATSSYGCLDTVTANVVVLPQAVLNLGDSVTLYPGQTYQMNPQTNCSSFLWFPPSGLSNANISDPLADPIISTKYFVYGLTTWGCKAVDSINIFVDPNTLLAVPNAFTPGNGPNGLFKIIVNGEASLNYFRVYNRWGNLVYSSTDITEGWDGTYKGTPQPFDVYVYEIEATTSTNTVFKKTGNVTLVR